MHSGTYGPKEPGAEPVELALLREGDMDQRLLPFAPIHLSSLTHLILHDLNGQPYPKKALVTTLKEDLDKSLEEAMNLGKRVGLSLPRYVREILPKLLCEDPENPDPFAYQLRPFFTPSALRVRWMRINRIKILLHAFINLCHRILYPHADWKIKQPVGIRADPATTERIAVDLVRAYLFFGVPITGLVTDLPGNYSVEQARDALLDPRSRKAPLTLELEGIIKLPEGSEDALTFKDLHPCYNALEYGEDGIRLTSKERKLLAYHEDEYPSSIIEPEPSNALVPFIPRLDYSAGDNVTPTPSTSTSATPSVFSSASASSRNPSGPDTFGPVRSARSNARSRDYRGSPKQPRARNKGRSVYERPLDSSRQYASPSSANPRAPYYRHGRSPEPTAPRYGPAYLPATTPSSVQSREIARPIEARLVPAQEEQRMVQDADTGNLAMIPIVRASFSQLGITRPQQSNPMPAAHSAPSHYRQETAPNRHPYPPREDHWVQEDRYPRSSYHSGPRQGHSRRPRENWDRQESRGQPSEGRSQERRSDDATGWGASDPTTGWGAAGSATGWGTTDSATGWGATDST